MTGPRLLEVLEITPGTFSASRHGTRSFLTVRVVKKTQLPMFFFVFFLKIVFTVHSGFGCWGLVVGIIFSLHVLCVLALIIANAPPGHISFVSMLLMVSVMIIVIFLLLTGWDTPISYTVYPYLFRSSIFWVSNDLSISMFFHDTMMYHWRVF